MNIQPVVLLLLLGSCHAAGQLVKVVETLGTYNVTVKELKFILSYLYTTQLWVSGACNLYTTQLWVSGACNHREDQVYNPAPLNSG